MESEYIEDLELLDPQHFWFKAKEQYLRHLIKKPDATILDVGCGSGRNMASFIKRHYKVIGIDINEQSVKLCQKKGYNVFKADLENEIPDIRCTPDYITAFDFLEHIQRPVNFLSNLRKLAGNETQLIVTVPSYQSLFSGWDNAMGHVKRYRRPILCNELDKGGWQVIQATYIHMLPLIPAIIIRKLFQPLKENFCSRTTVKREKFFTVSPLLNGFISKMYFPEFFFFESGWSLPFGLSVLAVASPKKNYIMKNLKQD